MRKRWLTLVLLLWLPASARAETHRARRAEQRRAVMLLALSPLAPLFVLLPPPPEQQSNPPPKIRTK